MHNLAVGIALQTIALSRAGTLPSYHFSIVWIVSLASMATHNSTLLVLGPYLSKDWILRWLRQVLILYQLALSCTYRVFVLRVKAVALPSTLPVACAWHHEFNNSAVVSPTTYVPTCLTLAGNCLTYGVATWYLHSRSQRFLTAAQVIGVTLMCLSAVVAIVRTLINSQAFGNPPVPLQDLGEKAWSIGQLMCIMLLGMPLVTALEIYRGDYGRLFFLLRFCTGVAVANFGYQVNTCFRFPNLSRYLISTTELPLQIPRLPLPKLCSGVPGLLSSKIEDRGDLYEDHRALIPPRRDPCGS